MAVNCTRFRNTFLGFSCSKISGGRITNHEGMICRSRFTNHTQIQRNRRQLILKAWLQYLFGGFFSNKIVIKNVGRSFVNAGFSLILAVVILFFGLYLGHVAAFPYHLGKSEGYVQAIQEAVDNGLVLEVEDGVATANIVINTIDNETDATEYRRNGVELIVDTRAIDTMYVHLDIQATNEDQNITYEAYLDLSDSEKSDYSLEVNLTSDVIDLGLFKDTAEAFLDLVTNAQNPDFNSDIAQEYNALKLDTDLSPEAYAKQLYVVYAKAYYPDLSEYSLPVTPTLHHYYSSLITDEIEYLTIYGDMCAGSFVREDITVYLNGYYTDISDFSSQTESMQSFLIASFRSARGVTAFIYVINLLQMYPYVLIVWIVMTIVAFIVAKLFRHKSLGDIFGDLTIIGVFLLMTSIISSLIGFISSFFLSREIAYMLATLSMYVVLVVRTILLLIPEMINQVRRNRLVSADSEDD